MPTLILMLIQDPSRSRTVRRAEFSRILHSMPEPIIGRIYAERDRVQGMSSPPVAVGIFPRPQRPDWQQARRDVQRFLKPHELPSLEYWTPEYFLQQCGKLGAPGRPPG